MRKLDSSYKNYLISKGTFNIIDLIPTFIDFLDEVCSKCDIIKEVNNILEKISGLEVIHTQFGPGYKDIKTSFTLYEQIYRLLENIAPEKCYFGTHNEAYFGFWIKDEYTEKIRSIKK